MKILVFTTTFPNNVWRNHGVFVKERIRRLAERPGYEIKVVAPVPYFPNFKIGDRWKYSQVSRQEMIAGLEVYHPRYLMTPKIGMSMYGFEMFVGSLSTVKRIRQEFDFDLISAHTVYPDGLAGVLLGRRMKCPTVVSARGSDLNLMPRYRLPRKLIRYTLRKADRSVAVCQALKNVVGELGEDMDKMSVIPNGVDLEAFRPEDREAVRRELGLVPGPMVLSVGELIPRKGFHLIIEAMSRLVREPGLQDLQLVIVGAGAMRAELSHRISAGGVERNVRLVGEVPHERLKLWYNAADVFCLASDREGYPNVVLEALACGTPVVATEVWGVPEIITTPEVGLLTKRDSSALADSLAAALSTSWNREAIRSFALSMGWDQRTESLQLLFESITQKGTD